MDLRGLCRLPGGRNFFLPTGVWSWVLSFWSARPCQGLCLLGSYVLRKTLSSLYDNGWVCVPGLLVVWPEMSQHWNLELLAKPW